MGVNAASHLQATSYRASILDSKLWFRNWQMKNWGRWDLKNSKTCNTTTSLKRGKNKSRGERFLDRHTHTDKTDRQTHTDTCTDRHTHTQTDTHRQTDRQHTLSLSHTHTHSLSLCEHSLLHTHSLSLYSCTTLLHMRDTHSIWTLTLPVSTHSLSSRPSDRPLCAGWLPSNQDSL